MIANHPFGACLPVFGNCADRFVLSGYGGGGKNMEEMLDLAAQVERLDGLELVGNWHVNDENVHSVAGTLKDRGFRVCMLAPDLWTQAKWGKGSLAAPDAPTRQAAVDEIKKALDWAAEIGCPYIDVWPGEDGFDYCFQADYQEAWKWLHDGLAVCADHNPAVKILVEYKPREPRTHCFDSTAAKTLLLLQDLKRVGVLLDVGHALAAGENPAEAAALLSQYGKLDYIHLNDNYRHWDDDMIVGSVHFVEYVELLFWLREIGYKGWYSMDQYPYREEAQGALRESVEFLKAIDRLLDSTSIEEIRELVRTGDAVKSTRWVRKRFLS